MKARKILLWATLLTVVTAILLGVTGSGALPPAHSQEKETSPDGKGYRFDRDGWIYVHIEGEPYERGYQYGYLVAEELAEILANTKDLTYLDSGMEWEFFVEQAEKQFVPHLDDELEAEIKGIAGRVLSAKITARKPQG